MLSKKFTLGAIATLVLVGSPLTAFAQNVQGNSYQPTNDATTSITQTDYLTNTVIQQDDEHFRQVTQAYRRRGDGNYSRRTRRY